MKFIDQTPFYKENGEISLIDRGKAIMQFGPGWFKEIEAQKSVIAMFKKNLDKKYTLLCNIIPPGLDARIPLILVGPTGVYVMSVTPKIGIFRARGDQWGTVSGNALHSENPNLLSLTSKMARAIQVYLQRQGYSILDNVEAVLLCSDPATTVDTMRPIIRVIMRDMLERFVVSITQARIVLNPESAFDIVNRLLNPPPPPSPKPEETPAPKPDVALPAQVSEPYVPTFGMPGSTTVPAPASVPPTQSTEPYVPTSAMPASTAVPAPAAVPLLPIRDAFPQTAFSEATLPPARPRLTRKQITFLIIMAVIWCLIVVVFAFLIARNMNPSLFMLK